ncbi:hypothetical protein KBY29_13820 [Ruegeria pomeroyi]|uniref:hypothetical protein n=1 Tax=Ruegeria pomeroyi TaxID=89184 RepID=UPI001F491803|nr:hypothetical protein [Ruegeria pomeroyi]MCE8507741.1 hypothetical protein [Ruegeria pomeroyi]MCE8555385.1 hypothetical protein [Ruegeria pomeroyi]
MVMDIHRERAAILGTSRDEDEARVSARVRLRFSLAGQQSPETSAIVVSVAVTAGQNQPWRRTRREILASAWHWLERYFDGASLESGDGNLFSDIFEEKPWQKGSGLTPTQERSLQRDLRRITREHAY